MDYSIHRKKPKTYNLSVTHLLLLLLLFYVILYAIDYFDPKELELKEKDITNDTRTEALKKSLGHVGLAQIQDGLILEVENPNMETKTDSVLTKLDQANTYLANNQTGFESVNNRTFSALTAGSTYTGTWENVASFASVTLACKTDQTGYLYCDFSPDGINLDSVLTFNLDPNINDVHRITITRPYFRLRVMNSSGSDQTYLRATALLGSQTSLTSVAGSTIQNDADTILTRSILTGAIPNGLYQNVTVDNFGHIAAAIHHPLLPFGSIHTEQLTPFFQFDGVYRLNDNQILATSNVSILGLGASGGFCGVSNSAMICETTTSNFGNAAIQSRKRVRYKAGQGSICRFSMRCSEPALYTYQVGGYGHSEDGYYFGYSNETFGILQVNRRKREIQELVVTTGCSSASNIVITLNKEEVIAVTNGTSNQTAWEIASHKFDGWTTWTYSNNHVGFLAGPSGNKNLMTCNFGTTGVVATSNTIRNGSTNADIFIPQTEWNLDVMDGSFSISNPSGINLDPQKANIYEIQMQYLGAGVVGFYIETTETKNNANISLVHQINNPNTLTESHVGNPSFPFTMSAYKSGATSSNLKVECYSVMGGIEGKIFRNGPLLSYLGGGSVGVATNDTTAIPVVFVIRNSPLFNGIPNQAVIYLQSLSFAARAGNNIFTTFYLIKSTIGDPGITFSAAPLFTEYDPTTSCALYASVTNGAITVTYTEQHHLIYSSVVNETGQGDFNFVNTLEEYDLQPSEFLVVAASASATGSIVRVGLNTREDQ